MVYWVKAKKIDRLPIHIQIVIARAHGAIEKQHRVRAKAFRVFLVS